MARLTGQIAAGLANPSYSGMLSSAVSGGMQGISDAYAQKRQRAADDSINTMLTNYDPTDPNVVNSIMAVGRQTGQDSNDIRAKVLQAQDQKMQQEAAARAKESHNWAQATATWNEKLRAKAVEEENAVKAGVAAYNKTKNPESALAIVPPEHQEEVLRRIENRQKFEEYQEKYKEYQAEGKPLSEDLLTFYEGVSDEAKQAVDIYREQVKNGIVPRVAAANLNTLIKNQQTASLYQRKDNTPTIKPTVAADIKAAKEFISTFLNDEHPSEAGWIGNKNLTEVQKDEIALALAHEKKNQPELPVTKDSVSALAEKVLDGTYIPYGMAQATAPEEGDVKLPEGITETLVAEAMKLNPGMSREAVIKELSK